MRLFGIATHIAAVEVSAEKVNESTTSLGLHIATVDAKVPDQVTPPA